MFALWLPVTLLIYAVKPKRQHLIFSSLFFAMPDCYGANDMTINFETLGFNLPPQIIERTNQ